MKYLLAAFFLLIASIDAAAQETKSLYFEINTLSYREPYGSISAGSCNGTVELTARERGLGGTVWEGSTNPADFKAQRAVAGGGRLMTAETNCDDPIDVWVLGEMVTIGELQNSPDGGSRTRWRWKEERTRIDAESGGREVFIAYVNAFLNDD